MDKILIKALPYIFGFLGIITLINHSYPLWASASLIALMLIATILDIATLVRKQKDKNGGRDLKND